MILQRFHLVVVSLSIGACSGGEPVTTDSQESEFPKPLPSNEEILAAVYDNTYQVPEEFYVDERADTPQSYSLYHLQDDSISYELCTDDYSEAITWEDADNLSRSVSGYYVGSVETENYFEVIRELAFPDDIGNIPDLTSPGFARVFKCSSVNRNGVDRNLRNGYGGTISRARLSVDTVRDFVEYLWQFTYFDTGRGKVLDSFTNERPGAYAHTLLLAFRISRGDNECDRIEVIDWIFSADKLSGDVNREFRFLFALDAHLNNGVPEQCQLN